MNICKTDLGAYSECSCIKPPQKMIALSQVVGWSGYEQARVEKEEVKTLCLWSSALCSLWADSFQEDNPQLCYIMGSLGNGF